MLLYRWAHRQSCRPTQLHTSRCGCCWHASTGRVAVAAITLTATHARSMAVGLDCTPHHLFMRSERCHSFTPLPSPHTQTHIRSCTTSLLMQSAHYHLLHSLLHSPAHAVCPLSPTSLSASLPALPTYTNTPANAICATTQALCCCLSVLCLN